MKAIKVEFTEKNLTGNAGLVHFGRFIDKLKLHERLNSHLSITRASNADYQAADVVVLLVLGVLAGAKHMSHMAILGMDSAIRTISGWKIFPVASTFSRIFKLFTHKHCNELSEVEDLIRRLVWKKKWFGRITIDLDSSVRGVFGTQEGAEKGYNPDKKGQSGYHPLSAFIAETCECLHNRFRSGNTYSANGVVEFMKECYARLPKGVWKVFVRGDSAFFIGALLNFLESKGAEYLIKVKMKGLVTLLSGKKWRKVRNKPGFEVTEFFYQCSGWLHPRRFVAVRVLVEVKTDGLLFPEYVYEYFCYVTNTNLTPWKAHKTYGKRATSENWIEWCKNQMAAGGILTQDFWANSAIFQTCILAYNSMIQMMQQTQEHKIDEEPNTIRFRLIHVPARLLTGSRRLLLKSSESQYFKGKWLKIEHALDCLSFA